MNHHEKYIDDDAALTREEITSFLQRNPIRPWRNLSRKMSKSCSLKRKRCWQLHSLSGLGEEINFRVSAMRWRDGRALEYINSKEMRTSTSTSTSSSTCRHPRDGTLSLPCKNSLDNHRRSEKSSNRNVRKRNLLSWRGRDKISFTRPCSIFMFLLMLTMCQHETLAESPRWLQGLPPPTTTPSRMPSRMPSKAPIISPTKPPTKSPSNRPTESPSNRPTKSPSNRPTESPSRRPTESPSNKPSKSPSTRPTISPTAKPTNQPSITISSRPSLRPSQKPSNKPSPQPSNKPSLRPSKKPSVLPSLKPSLVPSTTPSIAPSLIPSIIPSSRPTISLMPSSIPSSNPSFDPTSGPSRLPSIIPTSKPSITTMPSLAPSESLYPSLSPSQSPSQIPSTEPSITPTLSPSLQPSFSTRPSGSPSMHPSTVPSISMNPSTFPSLQPTVKPSSLPTSSPTESPSSLPSSMPSLEPTSFPSLEPTNTEMSVSVATFYQEFNITTELLDGPFQTVIEGYTKYFATGTLSSRIDTKCEVVNNLFIKQFSRTNLRYKIRFKSRFTNVTTYDVLFKDYINKNLETLRKDLSDVGIEYYSATKAVFLDSLTDAPTKAPTNPPSLQPSVTPTESPSVSPTQVPSSTPSQYPSDVPTETPSDYPSDIPSISPTSQPTSVPSQHPSNLPSSSPSSSPTIKLPSYNPIYVSVSAAVGGMITLFIMGFCLRRKCHKPLNGEQNNGTNSEHFPLTPSRTNGVLGGGIRTPNGLRHGYENVDDGRSGDHGISVVPSFDSMISHESIISTGSSVDGGSDDEYDDTQILADEFEKYKDQNLEKMRSKLEGNVSNFDGMMSQALTMALMDDDDDISESETVSIGDRDSIGIEADLLCEMNDWLKRTEGANVDDRREFMQESLNKMVASVRHGVISPEDASRTIHGCAALLGLQLAEDIPETTLIVTGMRKSVSREEVREAFKRFGDIESVGVSSNRRGFGIVRFVSKKYAHRALEHHRIGEIVVQDVAVSVRLMKADMPEIEVRRVYSNERRSR